MGLRLRKSIKIAPGVRLNLGTKSTGVSFGTKGARISINSKGRVTQSVGIPGTGLHYQKSSSLGGGKPSAASAAPQVQAPAQDSPAASAQDQPLTMGAVILLGMILLLPGLLLRLIPWAPIKAIGWLLIAGGAVLLLGSKKISANSKAKADAAKAAAETQRAALREGKRREFAEMLAAVPLYPVATTEDPGLAPLSPTDLGSLTYSKITARSNRANLSAFVAIDVETTGLDPYKDAIVEISAIRFYDFRPAELFTTLVRPPCKIPAKAQAIHHITDDMVAGAPTFGEVVVSLESFIGKSNLVGHNLPFDLGFLYRAGLDLTRPSRKYFDTYALSRAADPEGRHDLSSACERYGIIPEHVHSSRDDCLATGLLFGRLVDTKLGAPQQPDEE